MHDFLNKLLNELTEGTTSLTTLLSKLKVVAARLGRPDITRWCTLELDGWNSDNPLVTDDDSIPPYRTTMGRFSNRYGIPIVIDKQFMEELGFNPYQQHWGDPVAILEDRGKSVPPQQIRIFQHPMIPLLEKDTGEQVVYQTDTNAFRAMTTAIRGKATEIVTDLIISTTSNPRPIDLALAIFDHLRIASDALLHRRSGKVVLELNDEYDLQDIFYCCLKAVYPSLESEEWTPKYAGKNKKMDFILKEHQLAIELKFVRDSTHAKNVQNEIVEDMEYYSAHPAITTLLALVYDPEPFITKTRVSIEMDLSGPRTIKGKALNVLCRIRPAG